ncbi:MAG: hypothetical protein CL959_01850 [Euryarchaeota archaeon]|nr:hypothetical protein [Euryarchaeota archaeon]
MALQDAPSNNPKLVSYQRPELAGIAPLLQRAKDCWHLLPREGDNATRSVRAKYLPQEVGEPTDAYQGRIGRSSYPSTYRDAIRSFSGLLSRFQISEAPPSLEASLNDVDMRGSSLRRFLSDVDQLVLRDGAAAVLVEMPLAEPGVTSKIEEIRSGRRPYLVLLERSQVINWRSHLDGGREVLDLVVIRLEEEVPDGDYGSKSQEVFMVMVPGAYRKVTLRVTKAGTYQEEVLEEGTTSLNEIPMVWMGATTNAMGSSDVAMDALAQLSIEHMQLRSDLSELIHKCALPAGVRVGDSLLPDGSPKPLTIGPNSVLDLPEGGDFRWAEISGGSLQRHQEEVLHVEKLMKEASLSFLWGDGGNRTATEAALASSQVSSQVRALIEGKLSAFRQLLYFWTQYSGEKLHPESGISLSDSLLSKPMEANDVAQLTNLNVNGLISHQTTLEELQRGGVLDPDLNIEEELQRIQEEKELAVQETQAMMGMGETPGPASDPASFVPEPNEGAGEEVSESEAKKDLARKGA